MKSALAQCRALCDRAGFDPGCVTDALLEAAIRRRSIVRGAARTEDYAALLSANNEEQTDLLEELLVRESWFFRDGAPFELLANRLGSHWQQRGPERPLRFLSAPCANGEEPYSIAMLFRHLGVAADSLKVDALDLSRRALEAAALGSYTPRAVRLVPEAIGRQFFETAEGERRQVAASIRALVQFRRANLLELSKIGLSPGYDAIFVRNVLIYVTRAARVAILSALRDLLAPDGLLFVGHAEAGLLADTGLRPVGAPGAFAFEPVPAALAGSTPSLSTQRSSTLRSPPQPRAPVRRARAAAPAKETGTESGANRQSELNRVAQLADSGDYVRALVSIDTLLREQPAEVEAHHLRGLVLIAMNRTQDARAAFERALYLNPAHVSSLEHLARLLEAEGQHAAARRLDERAERAGAASC
jgi:chemotaxis protein methyltransferase WspC